MLQLKDLRKVYKTSSGEVHALDGVSIDFPETGMVFLLGRSGSGKSTLLNVAGGLDVPTSGEIIVEGRSSKDFTIADFDGYRNSFIGFVFQEFNILSEFTIEQNIALALQLQHKPNDPEAVNDLLKEVGLDGVGKRKPNTLSGGQKQRIAIARALIKNPKIIMADEPTGSLDSNTGVQILEMLKRLAKTRLVIVVTHDRTFAETYADRIIELADGKIISDLTISEEKVDLEQENVTFVSEDTVKVNDWNKVNEEDLKKILEVMKKSNGDTIITSNPEAKEEIKKVKDIPKSKIKREFKKTEKKEQKVVPKGDVKFIKAKLPFKNAMKMAFDSLKSKPLRLMFTILLSMVAFIFFGVSSTLMRFSPEYVIATALEGSDYSSITIERKYSAYFTTKEYTKNGIVEKELSKDMQAAFSVETLNELNKNDVGLEFAGIIDFGWYLNNLNSVEDYVEQSPFYLNGINLNPAYKRIYPVKQLCGYTDCGAEYMERNGFKFIGEEGRYPEKYDEIAISEYVFQIYNHPTDTDKIELKEGDVLYASVDEFILKGDPINIGGKYFKVVGVYDVGDIPERFNVLNDKTINLDTHQVEQLERDLKDLLKFSFHTLGFVSEDFYDVYKYDSIEMDERTTKGVQISATPITEPVNSEFTMHTYTKESIWKKDYCVQAYDRNGNEIDINLEENQVLLPAKDFLLDRITYMSAYDFYNAVLALPEAEQEEYTEFKSAYSKFRNNSRLQKERKIVLETVYRDYEKIMGEKVALPEVVYSGNYIGEYRELEVVGFYIIYRGIDREGVNFLVNDDFLSKYEVGQGIMSNGAVENVVYQSDYQVDPINERYGRLITPTKNTKAQTYFILDERDDFTWFEMKNEIYNQANQLASTMQDMKLAFYIAGAVFGVFAVLMLFNFISVTIHSKRKEIGILRAVGARKMDVFKIFIVEGLLITLSCFAISAVLSLIACNIINTALMSMADVTLSALKYDIISVLLLFGVSIAVALFATSIPVYREAKKAPVDSIRST